MFKQVITILVLATLLACSLSVFVMSSAVRTAVPSIAESAPAVVREFRQTDTLDELQEFSELERPSRPVWPFVLALFVVVGMFTLVAGAPFLKQANSLIRQVKPRKKSHGRAAPPALPGNPIILPPGYGTPQLPPPAQASRNEETEW